jgi:hypothetical protein
MTGRFHPEDFASRSVIRYLRMPATTLAGQSPQRASGRAMLVQSLCGALSQGLIALCDFEHLPPRNRIKYFIGNFPSFFGPIMPMLRLVE